jgi:hypothetical protein
MPINAVKRTIIQYVSSKLDFGRPVPTTADRITELDALRLRRLHGSVRLEDIKRLLALKELDGHWSTKPFRILMSNLGMMMTRKAAAPYSGVKYVTS